MANYLLIESRDPYRFADAQSFCRIATDLARAGNTVTVFLVQNGVLPARKGAADSPIPGLQQSTPDVTILADDFSLKERSIAPDKLVDGVSAASIERLVDLLAEPGTKAIWH